MESGLKMGFWNLNYLEEKMSNEAFKREVSKCDILFLCETWLHRKNINNSSHPKDICITLFLEIKGEKKLIHQGGLQCTSTVNSTNLINQMKVSNTNIACLCNSTKTQHTLKKMNAVFSSLWRNNQGSFQNQTRALQGETVIVNQVLRQTL